MSRLDQEHIDPAAVWKWFTDEAWDFAAWCEDSREPKVNDRW